MEPASLKDIRAEIKNLSEKELQAIVLRLGRFKKENKELLTYLLFEESDEHAFVTRMKREMDAHFDEIDSMRYYIIKKNVRKVLTRIKKIIRYSSSKETEVDLLLHFCRNMLHHFPFMDEYPPLENIFIRQYNMCRRKLDKLHEDLQYDYLQEWAALVEQE
ncbi:MAG: hypothetical protein AAGN35_00030 [Bacteroidota bacterium]